MRPKVVRCLGSWMALVFFLSMPMGVVQGQFSRYPPKEPRATTPQTVPSVTLSPQDQTRVEEIGQNIPSIPSPSVDLTPVLPGRSGSIAPSQMETLISPYIPPPGQSGTENTLPPYAQQIILEGVRALEEKQQVQTAKFLKKKDSFRFKRGDSGSALPDEIDSVCTMQSLSKMGEKKAEDAAPIRTSVGGLVANWRYNAEAQRQFNASKSQEVAGNAKYYSGSALDVGRVPVMRGRDVFRPDHTNIAVTRRGGTRTVTYAPPLHAFENNSLGSYQFSGTSGSSHQLRADISGQCRGAGCVVLILRGSANQPTEAHLRTSFTASSSLKEIRFDYSLYGGGHYSPAVFSVNVLGSSNERVATTIIGDDYQCPPNESRGYYSCSLSPRNIGLGELTPNQSYTIDFTFLTTNNPALHELSLDNIQFLDTQNREYGGPRQTTSETQNTYENVFTEFSTVQGVRVSDTLTAYFQNVNNWVIMLPFPGSALNVGVLSALPNDVQNPRHILSYNNLEVPMSSQDSGNKKNYAGSASLNILPTHNNFALTVTSQHQYTAQYPAAFTDTIAGVLDRRPPQVSASLKLPFKDFATTEVSVGVDFNATDDVALNSVGVTKRSGGTGVRIVDNAVAVSTVGGRSVRAVTALSAGAGGTIRIPQLDAATTSLDVFVTDWVASGSSFRAAFSAPLPVKVYDLANTHVVCDKYKTTVGDPIRCRWSQASKPFNSIVLVQQADKSKTIRFRDFPTQHRGGEKPVELYYDQRTQIFAADKPGEYDLEGFFFDSTPTEPQLVRRSNKVARIVVEEGSPAKPTAVRVNEGFASIFPPRRFACPGSGVTRVKFFRKDSPQATNLLELGVMDIDEAMRRGFTDGHVVQNSKPVYYVKPMYGEEEGVLSLGDTTTLVTARPKVTLDAMPRPGKPTHLQIEWIASAGGGADPLIPSPQQRSGQRETLLVPQRPGSALAFKTGRDLLYKSKLLLPATPMQSAPLAADANLANRLLADEKGEMPELTDAGYAGLLDDHLHPIVEHGFLILGGDFTKPALAPEQLYSLVDLVDSFVVSSVVSFLPPNSPGGERCSAEGDFEGMRFVCESAYNALFVLLPTLSPSLSEALTKFWFDPQNNGGLLVSMAFKKWCDDNLDACIPNASSRNFSNLDQMPETARESYARALATQDAAEMAWRDRLYAANAANEEGRCLFQTECSYDLDWLPYFDAYFVQRYFQPFYSHLIMKRAKLEQEARPIAIGLANLEAGFYADSIAELEVLRVQSPQRAALVDNVGLYIAENGWAANMGEPAYRNIFKPILTQFAAYGQGVVKGMAHNMVERIVWTFNYMACNAAQAVNINNCAPLLEMSQTVIENAENALNDAHDPYTINAAAHGWAAGKLELPFAVVPAARAFASAPSLFQKVAARAPVMISQFFRNAQGTLENVVMQTVEGTTPTGIRTFVTFLRSQRGAIKIINIGDDAVARNAAEAEERTTELLGKIFLADDEALLAELGIQSPNNPLKAVVQNAQASGQPVVQAIKCSKIGKKAGKAGFTDVSVTPDPNNSTVMKVAFRRPPENYVPHPTNLDEWPSEIIDPPSVSPAGRYPRAPSGTPFFRGDRSFEKIPDARAYAQKIFQEGVGPGKESKAGIPLFNHLHNAEIYCGGHAEIGGGPIAQGGWVSTSYDDLIARGFTRLRAKPYRIEIQGRVGQRSVAYQADAVGLEEAEIAFPNRIPASDIEEVKILDYWEGDDDASMRILDVILNPNFRP